MKNDWHRYRDTLADRLEDQFGRRDALTVATVAARLLLGDEPAPPRPAYASDSADVTLDANDRVRVKITGPLDADEARHVAAALIDCADWTTRYA